MTLEAAALLTELQRFADPSASVFSGWPVGRVDARHHWAHAYALYVDDMIDVDPVLSPRGVTLSFTGVEPAFFATLTLVNATVEQAALDFASAWRAAIEALALGSSAVNGSSVAFSFIRMESIDVATRFEALRAQLVVVFRRAMPSRREDLKEIADAFHVATLGLVSVPGTSYPVRYG